MVATVGTFAQNEILRSRMRETQAEFNALQVQVSSGKKSDSYSGLGEGARLSLSLRQTKTSTETFIRSNAATDVRMQQMQTVMDRIKDLTNDMKITAYSGVSSASTPAGQGNFTIRTAARGTLAEIVQLLNSQVDGYYLFAGRSTDAPPMLDPGAVGTPGTPLGSAAALAAANPLGNTPGTGDALYEDIADHLDGTTVGAVPGAVPVRYYVGEFSATTGSHMVSRIDTSTDVTYGVTGRDASLNKVTQALYALSVGVLDATNEMGYRQLARRAVEDLEAGFQGIVEQIGALGVVQTQLKEVTVRQQDFITTLDLQIGSVEDVDMSEALSKLGATQTELEASYRMLALMRELSITKYL